MSPGHGASGGVTLRYPSSSRICCHASGSRIDVRRLAEYESGHAPGAITAPLAKLREVLPALRLDLAKPTAVICAGGYRSSAATSILQPQGFVNLLNVTGGTTAWIKAGYEVEMPS